MKKLLLILILVASLFGEEDLEYELNNMTLEQYKVLVRVYKVGVKYDLQYTLMAIAWQESKFGKYMVNLNDPSAGVFHNNIESVCSRENNCNEWNKSRLFEKLLFDFDFASKHALAELEFWKNYYTNKNKNANVIWTKTIKSYNAGFRLENGLRYSIMIKAKVRVLQKYIKNHPNIFNQIIIMDIKNLFKD